MSQGHPPQRAGNQSIRSGPVPVTPLHAPIDEEPLELEPEFELLEPEPVTGESAHPLTLEEEPAKAAPSKIKAFGVAGPLRTNQQWKRHSKANGLGAIRVRSFHGKLSEQGLDFMDNQINEWVDSHPEIEIKQVTTAIGQFEGKIREPALVVNVWY